MELKPQEIFEEYRQGVRYKSSLGNKGMYEQNRINERFYLGDQWYGAKCGSDRPLVRHNVIKRIGEYKMSQVLSSPIKVNFSAEGIPTQNDLLINRQDNLFFENTKSEQEINLVTKAFGKYFNVTAERLNLNLLQENVLRNSYITGTGVLYTYWDPLVQTGLFADESMKSKITGDICCQVLDIDDVYFGDRYIDNLQSQPYIIISSQIDIESVLREARLYGANITTLRLIEDSQNDGKITVLTRLFKEYKSNGSYTIKCVKVCEKAFIREEFDTNLRLYPLCIFKWERRNDSIYGESEITHLIPNQIAINRMITANVWSAMTTGMPIMLVNGDTVDQRITNEPGQVIKVFGSNEDVAGAVKYVTPPAFTKEYDQSINTLIENTMKQSGANEVALGDSRADNASALNTMRNAAIMPLQIIKNRFYGFVEEIAKIWAEFWIVSYGKRKIKITDSSGVWYMPFDGERYKDLIISTKIDVGTTKAYSESEAVSTLLTLFEKGVINRKQLIERLPEGVISDKNSILEEGARVNENDGL